MSRSDLSSWRAYHLFYHHASHDQVLLEFVQPLVRRLWLKKMINGFFFVRYRLGGPHLRIRLRYREGSREAMDEMTRAAATDFLKRKPSTETFDEAAIREANKLILMNDGEGEDVVFENNTFVESSFNPEIQRYGGQELFGSSLDFFMLSSVHVLRFLERYKDASKTQVLAASLRTLLAPAVGFARCQREVEDLVSYASIWNKGAFPSCEERGNEVFERQRESLCVLVRRELETLWDPRESDPMASLREGARLLAAEIRAASETDRWEITSGQVHMTANRLGLNNGEETYLGRILLRALQSLAVAMPDFWGRFGNFLAERAVATANGQEPLRALVHREMSEI